MYKSKIHLTFEFHGI